MTPLQKLIAELRNGCQYAHETKLQADDRIMRERFVAADVLEAQASKLERLTVAHDEWREACLGHGSKANLAERRAADIQAKLEAQAAQLENIRIAASPFIDAIAFIDDDTAPDQMCEDDKSTEYAFFEHQQPTVGDFRKLRATLTTGEPINE